MTRFTKNEEEEVINEKRGQKGGERKGQQHLDQVQTAAISTNFTCLPYHDKRQLTHAHTESSTHPVVQTVECG